MSEEREREVFLELGFIVKVNQSHKDPRFQGFLRLGEEGGEEKVPQSVLERDGSWKGRTCCVCPSGLQEATGDHKLPGECWRNRWSPKFGSKS